MSNCLNCNHPLSGDYCSKCGQKDIHERITMKLVFHYFIQTVFLFEHTIYKTILHLLTKPGTVAKEFIRGKRKLYTPPFQFFLLCMTIYLLLLGLFGDDIFQFFNSSFAESPDNSRLINFQLLIRKNLNILFFVLTPILALFIKLFFRKLNYNYAEMLIFALYIIGFNFLLSGMFVLGSLINVKVYAFKSVITFTYLGWCIVHFTEDTSLSGIVKSLLVTLLSYAGLILVLSIIVFIYVFL